MSIKIMSKVFKDQTLDSNKKLIMLALSDNANDEGYCYPSINTIVEKTSLSKPTVIKHIKDLESKGLLISKRRNRKNGSSTSKIYVVYPFENLDNLDEDIRDKFIQSKEALPHPQSKEALPLNGGQSKEALPLEPSLTLFNHPLYKKLSKNEKDLYLEYTALRKKMKVQTTLSIHERLLAKYFEFGGDVKIIENAITANWKDFYQPKQQNFQQKSKRQNFNDLVDETLGTPSYDFDGEVLS